jgi:hypothetical protein
MQIFIFWKFISKSYFEEIEKHNILKRNYQNPFNPITKIKFILAELQNYRISIYIMIGEEIQVLTN